jgi:1,4-dihydroxy-6-naphthoate synthase
VIRRDLGPEMMSRVSRLLHASIKHALDHRDEAVTYAEQFGRGLDRARTDRFVGMYVNELTLDYGNRGREAVRRFLAEAWDARLIPAPVRVEFVS